MLEVRRPEAIKVDATVEPTRSGDLTIYQSWIVDVLIIIRLKIFFAIQSVIVFEKRLLNVS